MLLIMKTNKPSMLWKCINFYTMLPSFINLYSNVSDIFWPLILHWKYEAKNYVTILNSGHYTKNIQLHKVKPTYMVSFHNVQLLRNWNIKNFYHIQVIILYEI